MRSVLSRLTTTPPEGVYGVAQPENQASMASASTS